MAREPGGRTRRLRTWSRRLPLGGGILLLGLVAAGQLGLLAGSPPADLGVHQGRLKPAPATPNCVSSQSADEYARIAPFAYAGEGAPAMARLQAIVAALPAARIVESRADYLYAEFTSKWLGFVDDVEFQLDARAGVIHLRSASRLGRSDLGANRRRIEALRLAFASGQ